VSGILKVGCVASMSTPTRAALFHGNLEANTIRKLKLRILPFIWVLYIVAFVDRINISFAALTMNHELAINSEQFGLLTGIFFIGYFFFEIPSNLLLHRIGVRVWIARILITWGAVAVLTGFVRTVHDLYFVRFLLGLAEAGFAPGMLLYLTYWFRQREQAQAVGLYLTGMPIATIVGAPLSGVVLDHIHWLGLSSWRWLLILEGIPAILCGILTYFLLPGRPEEAKFLTGNEKQWLQMELAREQQSKTEERQFSVLQALMSGRVWHLVAIYFGVLVGLYSLNYWAPQFVKSLSTGFSNTVIGFLLMVPSLVGVAAMILISRSSDNTLERCYHVAIPTVIGAVALLLLGTTHSPFLAVALLCFVSIGVYGFFGPFWALPSEFLTGFSAAAGLALINSAGNLAGFVGPYMIGALSRKTHTLYTGFGLAGVFMFAATPLVLLIPKPSHRETVPDNQLTAKVT
jgi:MFS transporter, ACS family, tartrate transporter